MKVSRETAGIPGRGPRIRILALSLGSIVGLATDGQTFTLFTESFTVTSADSTNILEWRTLPLPFYDHTKIRYRLDGTCPTDPTAALDPISTDLVIPTDPGPAAKGQVQHVGLPNRILSDPTSICYAAYVSLDAGETSFSTPLFARGRPFVTSGPAKWAFNTGATAVVPPGIGGLGVYVPSNDRTLYAIRRGDDVLGSGAGLWLPTFVPLRFQQPVQSRPPTVPLVIGPASPVAFAASQDGNVMAVDANQGDGVPANGLPDPIWTTNIATTVQAAPAAWLQAFGGDANWVLLGTRLGTNNSFFALQAVDGLQTNLPNGQFTLATLGAISGGASVDYVNKRVYFTSRNGGSGNTAHCLSLVTIPGFEGFGPCWSVPVGDVDYGPILRNGFVFVARNSGTVVALNASTGAAGWTSVPIGLPNGFPVLDRTNEDLYITAGFQVWALTHLAPTARWSVGSIPSPSQPLFATIGGTGYVFVGSNDGRLYQIDAASGTVIRSVLLGGGGSVIGAPSLDALHNLIYVGSDVGFVHAVRVPLP